MFKDINPANHFYQSSAYLLNQMNMVMQSRIRFKLDTRLRAPLSNRLQVPFQNLTYDTLHASIRQEPSDHAMWTDLTYRVFSNFWSEFNSHFKPATNEDLSPDIVLVLNDVLNEPLQSQLSGQLVVAVETGVKELLYAER